MAVAFALLAVIAPPVRSSEVELSGLTGHPRSRFPLSVYVAPTSAPNVDAPVRRAVDDWNAVFQETFGVQAFSWSATRKHAAVTVTLRSPSARTSMGETEVEVGHHDVIRLPIRIALAPPKQRGETPADVVLYQVAAHELGHALGLPHSSDPKSIMCCVKGSVDFSDPETREAYVAARRQPTVRSVTGELTAHYEAFWKRR